MKRNRWIFALALLLVSSLACNALTRGARATATESAASGNELATQAPSTEESTVEPPVVTAEVTAEATTGSFKTEFPLPDNVSNFTDMGNGAINFQTKMSLKDAIAFYRDAFVKAGYKERTINTAITDTTFSMVFDGHSSGKAIVIQGVDLGGGSVNINIRFEDI